MAKKAASTLGRSGISPHKVGISFAHTLFSIPIWKRGVGGTFLSSTVGAVRSISKLIVVRINVTESIESGLDILSPDFHLIC